MHKPAQPWGDVVGCFWWHIRYINESLKQQNKSKCYISDPICCDDSTEPPGLRHQKKKRAFGGQSHCSDWVVSNQLLLPSFLVSDRFGVNAVLICLHSRNLTWMINIFSLFISCIFKTLCIGVFILPFASIYCTSWSCWCNIMWLDRETEEGD